MYNLSLFTSGADLFYMNLPTVRSLENRVFLFLVFFTTSNSNIALQYLQIGKIC